MAYADNIKRFQGQENDFDAEWEPAHGTVWFEIDPDSNEGRGITIPFAEFDAMVAHINRRRAA